jgi:hypothetical protein
MSTREERRILVREVDVGSVIATVFLVVVALCIIVGAATNNIGLVTISFVIGIAGGLGWMVGGLFGRTGGTRG